MLADPDSVEGWLALARQHEEVARVASESKDAAGQGYFHAVMAAECLLKGFIWRKERFNEPPSKDVRPELYGHNLRVLKDKADIVVSRHDPAAPSWAVVLQGKRDQYYDPKPMPRRIARSMLEAVFGEKGVAEWLRKQP